MSRAPSERAKEAAWPIMRWLFVDDPAQLASFREQYMNGDHDDLLVVQAFAQFEAETLERAAKVADMAALAPAASREEKPSRVATAIRNLIGDQQ